MNKNKPPQRLTTDELDAAMRMRGGEMFRPSEWEKARQYTGHGVNPMFRDIYSQAKGSLDGQGYGYYNSQGPLQLTDNMKMQLSTRGMNSTGATSSIGGSAV